MGDKMVRDVGTAMFWVVFLSMMVPALYVLEYVTRLVACIDSWTAYPIGDPWYRFIEWYFGLVLDSLGVPEDLDIGDIVETSPNAP